MTVKRRPMDIPGRFTKVSSLRKSQKILSGERQQPLVEMGQKMAKKRYSLTKIRRLLM